MKVVYSDNMSFIPDGPSIFLAGPSLRGQDLPDLNWRIKALSLLNEANIKYKLSTGNDMNLTVFIPLPEHGVVDSYDNQVDWEEKYLERVTVILFWIPRNLDTLLGLTTNFEFGEYYKSSRTIYGRPDTAKKINYLDHKFKKHRPEEVIYTTLEETISRALEKLILLQ